MVDTAATVAVGSASAKLRVERIEGVSVQRASFHVPYERPDMLPELADVRPLGVPADVQRCRNTIGLRGTLSLSSQATG
jgi:hypothetical protein